MNPINPRIISSNGSIHHHEHKPDRSCSNRLFPHYFPLYPSVIMVLIRGLIQDVDIIVLKGFSEEFDLFNRWDPELLSPKYSKSPEIIASPLSKILEWLIELLGCHTPVLKPLRNSALTIFASL